MSELGVISSSSDGSYGGDEPINRYDTAEALYGFMQCVLNEVYKNDPSTPRRVSEVGFAFDVGDAFKPKVEYLLDLGIMSLQGEGGDLFEGNKSLTGDQALHVIAQLLKSYNLQSAQSIPSQPPNITQSLPSTAPLTPSPPKTGAVTINSIPSGATVYIDNNPVGTTPLKNHSLVVGSYSLKLVLAEYEDVDQRLEVSEGITEQSFTLPPIVKTGAVTINSTPSGATVYIDNNLVGTTPLNNHSLVVGSYSLKLVLAEHEDVDQRLEVSEGITEQSFTLSPIVKTGAVTINSIPSGATVYIDNNPVGTTPLNNHSLVIGSYSLKLVLAEHEDVDQRLEISEGITEQSFTLSPIVKTGAVTINSIPSGATVYIDNNLVGTTPLNNHSLVIGSYSLKLVLAEHEDVDQRLEISEGITEQSFTLPPIIKTGIVTITSTPSNAKVYIDGEHVGQTPLENYSLAAGSYELKVNLDGHEDRSGPLIIEEDQLSRADLKLPLLVKASTVTIISEPSRATVYIDDEQIGQTPLEDYSLAVGSYNLKVTLDDYENWSDSLIIESEKHNLIDLKLTPLKKLGTATITSIPSNAEVYLDGEYAGQTPLENYPLEIGNHDFRMTLDGEDLKGLLKVEEGKTTLLEGDFELLSIPSEPDTVGTASESVEAEFTNMMTELAEADSIEAAEFTDTMAELLELDPVTTVAELVSKAQQGGKVSISAGRYVLDTPLVLSNNVELIGEGLDKTFIVSSTEEYVVKFEGDGQFIARGISFEHVGDQWAHVLRLTDGVVQVDNCRFSGGRWNQDSDNSDGGVGLFASGRVEGAIRNSIFESNGLHGIEVIGETQLSIERNTISNNAQVGIIYTGNAGGIAISNAIEENGGDGIYIASESSNLRIESNKVHYNEGYGIFIEGYSYGALIEDELFSSFETNSLTENRKGGIGIGQ